MSILTKPYEISVYEDRYEADQLVEYRVGIIGAHNMTSPNRALEPTLTRNVNGVKKLSFKMYKRYTDAITGEEVENPFIDWLVSERKVKLKYNNKWFDFIIKDIKENSANYLYTYSLEDALVQELSKNGFNMTLDPKLMNNTDNAKGLGDRVLSETDWNVESEVFVEKIEESLVYINIPAGTRARHLLDQTDLSQGVLEDSEEHIFNNSVTALAFYSCCKNKPHRFQFIYSEKGYNLINGKYSISRKDDRIIDEENCQYYIDFDEPDIQYTSIVSDLDLVLPTGFTQGTPGFDASNSKYDTQLSHWYRGKKYGYAQQSIYVPLLEKYCNKYRRQENIPLIENFNIFHHSVTGDVIVSQKESGYSSDIVLNGCISTNFITNQGVLEKIRIEKKHPHVGLKLVLNHHPYDTYILKYTLTVDGGILKTIGGHNAHYEPIYYQIYKNDELLSLDDPLDGDSYVNVPQGSPTDTYQVEIAYRKRASDNGQEDLFLQPNRGMQDYIDCTISNLSLTMEGDYLGYTDSSFVSPTLIQNCITNHNFESNSGWTTSSSVRENQLERAEVLNQYGRFDINEEGETEFINILDDFYNGEYSDEQTYKTYMKISCYNTNQFILNSGIKDNRTLIGFLPEGDKWVLDYKIVNKQNISANDAFTFEVGEYIYDVANNRHVPRSGFINMSVSDPSEEELNGLPSGYGRKIITVDSSSYKTEENFKNGAEIYLKIAPKQVLVCNAPSENKLFNQIPEIPRDGDILIPANDIQVSTITYKTNKAYKYSDASQKWEEIDKTPEDWYIESISLYRLSQNNEGNIIIPDYESENSQTAEEYLKNGVIEHKYKYFNQELLSEDDITDASQLSPVVKNSLNYTIYKPVYNYQAEKIRTVSAKESNYFNILQNIAETFEAWLDLEVTRDDYTGAVTGKTVKFKNYIGAENYANFRYGVNLKDIERTYSSKNIVTKLIVKQNSNELAQDGFCSIARADANPTKENYIYDFQYYQNTGIMDTQDYLDTAYQLAGAVGQDAELWKDNSVINGGAKDTTLRGYYPRIQKINEAILPINEEIIGLNKSLVKKKADLEVAKATKDAASQGIKQTNQNFLALTSLYLDEISIGEIKSIQLSEDPDKPGVVPQEDWWHVQETPVIRNKDKTIEVKLKVSSYEQDCRAAARVDQGTVAFNTVNGTRITKSDPYTGISISTDWEYRSVTEGYRVYTLSYDLLYENGDMKNIGCHNAFFNKSDFCIKIWDITDSAVDYKNTEPIARHPQKGVNYQSDMPSYCEYSFVKNHKYHIEISGSCYKSDYTGSKDLWIQPNRSLNDEVTCVISNIFLTKTITTEENTVSYDRKANFYLNTVLTIGNDNRQLERTFKVNCNVPANASSVTVTHGVTSIDAENSNVKNYILQYQTYDEKLTYANAQIEKLTPEVNSLEAAIKEKTAIRKKLIEYKALLNEKFFKKYSRFILEGTWISEEYVDDNKYFADAQSVLYNSCYPQAAYNINVVSLKSLPGYELMDFDLGDKTNIIDEQFFGNDLQEEVVVTELIERLDDPSKNNIKVQTFKNQFQDLFQKITATVQQTQYSTGDYEKGKKFAEASIEKRNKFVTDAINEAQTFLNYGQTVTVEDGTGITITETSNRKNQLRLVGGAILFSTEDPETLENSWMTGITNQGISANLITAGRLDTSEVQIMSGDKPVFRWDVHGISAYDAFWNQVDNMHTISGINTKKFIRFDKNGIYGINNQPGVDGGAWYPSDNSPSGKSAQQLIDEKATFSLTWEGLKVTQNYNAGTSDEPNWKTATARIGNYTSEDGKQSIIKINNGDTDTLLIDANGNLTTRGTIFAEAGDIAGWEIRNSESGDKGCSITSGDIGEQDSFGLFTYFPDGEKVEVCSSGEKSNWRILVGTSFGVDKYGQLFARAGQIGNMTISDLIGHATAAGNNLAIGTANNYSQGNWVYNKKDCAYGGQSGLSLTTDTYYGTKILQWNGNTTNEDSVGPCISVTRLIPEGYDIDKTYTLSLWLKADYDTTLDLSALCEGHYREDKGEDNKVTTSWKRFSTTFTINPSSKNNICIYTGGGAKDGSSQVYMCGIKIEEGGVATSWCPANFDAMSSDINAEKFSWSFSQEHGIKMWKGPQDSGFIGEDENLIFKIGLSEDEKRNELFMKGRIEATSGKIGGAQGWEIGQDTIASYDENGNSALILNAGQSLLYPSLHEEGASSPVRIQGGSLLENKMETKTIKFQASQPGDLVSQTVAVPDKYRYLSHSYSPTSRQHSGGQNSNNIVVILRHAMYDQNDYYSVGHTVVNNAYPSWVPAEFVKISDPPYGATYTVLGGGQVYVRVAMSGKFDTFSCSFRCEYDFSEDIALFVEEVGPNIQYVLKPLTSKEYDITITTKYITSEPFFKLLADGSLYVNEARLAGSITADTGRIGNWLIDSGGTNGKILFNRGKETSTGKHSVGMAALDHQDYVVLWAGTPEGLTPWEYNQYYGADPGYSKVTPFFVTNQGKLYCSNVEATGGKIGSIDITTNGLKGNNWSLTSKELSFVSNATLKLGGTIIKTDNKNNCTMTTSAGLKIQSSSKAALEFGSISESYSTSATGEYEYKGDKVTFDLTLAKAPNNPVSITVYWYCYATKKDNQSGSWTFTTEIAKVDYSKEIDCEGYARGEQYIGFSLESAEKAESQARERGYNLRDDKEIVPNGNAVYYSLSSEQSLQVTGDLFPTNAGFSIGSDTDTRKWKNIFGKDVYADTVSAGIVFADDFQSDERVKNSIESLPESYEVFYNLMRPTRYKYNNGSSDRYHTGFIAQELVQSLMESNLTTKDFAGVVLHHPGEEDECWYLRRDEFVALNTWQIQKLKPRVSTLEQTIIDYETRISNLETEIQNLKSR